MEQEKPDYDCETDDEAVINTINNKAGKKVITEIKFEQLIDFFEIEAFNHGVKLLFVD